MKIKSSDALFGIQIAGMLVSVFGQSVRMIDTVQGISPAWLICAEAFCILSLGLAYQGWKKSPSRATTQLVITHAGWTAGVGLLLILLARKANEVTWGWYDTTTFLLVIAATIVTLASATSLGLGITDPIVRGILAGIYRGTPHLSLCYKILLLGGNGLSPAMVWAANLTACVRIWQLILAVKESGWDRTRRRFQFGSQIGYNAFAPPKGALMLSRFSPSEFMYIVFPILYFHVRITVLIWV